MASSTFGTRAYKFYLSLDCPKIPKGIECMNPYKDSRVRGYVKAFLNRFYSDSRPRTLIFGINPGRFGAGITGITFTDPIRLADVCGIENHLVRRKEPSSEFVYRCIAAVGSPDDFFGHYFLTAVCPLGFTKDGGRKNVNYYDRPDLQDSVEPFIIDSVRRHLRMGARRDRAFLLGAGKNEEVFAELNREHRFFDELTVLPHPAWVQVYVKKNQRQRHLTKYKEAWTIDQLAHWRKSTHR